MTAITSYSEYLTALKTKQVDIHFDKAALGSSGALASWWTSLQFNPSLPSAPVTCVSSDLGALNSKYDGASSVSTFTEDVYLANVSTYVYSTGGFGMGLLVDRLSHMGGLSGLTTGTITTNLPTAALPRYTTGAGVVAAIHIYTAIGATATTASISYTNQAGTSGRTSKDVVFGGTGNNTAGRVIVLPLQDGDTGVRSIESITVAASTGTAGNYGVVLFKPLYIFPLLSIHSYRNQQYTPLIGGGCQFEPLTSNACLELMTINNGTGAARGSLGFIKV